MSEIARLAGDVLCVGLPGDKLGDDALRTLEALAPGAIVLFARNVTTLLATRALMTAARDAAGADAPMLVCVDQEGGRVARVNFGASGMPAMMALGAANDEALAERAGMHLALQLRAIGANVDFAPVLDLALEAESTVIGTRALGDDPVRVAPLGAALVRGLQAGGVAAAPKHFPGHGATALDSHCAPPIVATPPAQLRARELVPFGAAFAAGARAVMSAHVVVRAIDAGRPATLSPRVLTDLLRDELGFRGVCFTDCLQMDAIARSIGTVGATAAALAAGADSCVISHDLLLAVAARDAIVAAVADGSLPLARLEEASARVRALRRAVAEPSHIVAESPASDVCGEVAARAIAVVHGDVRLDREAPVTVISFEGDVSDGIAGTSGERPSLSLALRRRRLRSESMRVALEPDAAMRALLLDLVREQGARNIVLVARRAHLHAAQRTTIEALLAIAPHAVAVSAREPFDVPLLRRARGVVCSFGDEEAAIEALADVMVGRTLATGTLPVALHATGAR